MMPRNLSAVCSAILIDTPSNIVHVHCFVVFFVVCKQLILGVLARVATGRMKEVDDVREEDVVNKSQNGYKSAANGYSVAMSFSSAMPLVLLNYLSTECQNAVAFVAVLSYCLINICCTILFA